MATVAEHYERLLADVYSWMYGGWDAALARYTAFFTARGVAPRGSAVAIDLGAGCGFQAIPLARLGFAVTAIDLDEFEPASVKVHDLVHRRVDGQWRFGKSFYRKLRLSTAWVVVTLRAAGFEKVETGLDRGLVVVTAKK